MPYPDLPSISETKLEAIKMLAAEGGEVWLDGAPWPAHVKTLLRAWLFPKPGATQIDLDDVPSLFSGDEVGDVDVILAEIEKSISELAYLGDRLKKDSIDPREMIAFQKAKTGLFDRWTADKRALNDMREVARFKGAVTKILEKYLSPEQRAEFAAALRANT